MKCKSFFTLIFIALVTVLSVLTFTETAKADPLSDITSSYVLAQRSPNYTGVPISLSISFKTSVTGSCRITSSSYDLVDWNIPISGESAYISYTPTGAGFYVATVTVSANGKSYSDSMTFNVLWRPSDPNNPQNDSNDEDLNNGSINTSGGNSGGGGGCSTGVTSASLLFLVFAIIIFKKKPRSIL
jgi:hypothetical protein